MTDLGSETSEKGSCSHRACLRCRCVRCAWLLPADRSEARLWNRAGRITVTRSLKAGLRRL